MEISSANQAQIAAFQSTQEQSSVSANTQANQVQQATNNEPEQSNTNANPNVSTVNISDEARSLLANEQAQLQSGGSTSGKPR